MFDMTNKSAQRAFEQKVLAEAKDKAARVAVAEAKLEVDRKAAAKAAQQKADDELRESVKRAYLSNPAATLDDFFAAWNNGLRERVLEQKMLDNERRTVHPLYRSF
jgi:membrane protein involved in colicin uptake